MGQDEIVVPDASVRPAEPSAGSSAIPTSPDALGEGGRVPSNRTLPEAPPHQRFACLPPVVDSLYLTCETGVRPDFLAPSVGTARKGQVPRREVGSWVIQPTPKTPAFIGYTHMAIGHGERADILVVIGPATVAANVPSRRKVRVQIGSSVCWRGACKGWDALGVAREVFRVLHGDVLAYLPPENEVKPRRVDVCIDHWGYQWRMLDLNDFSGRPKSRGVIEDHPDEPHDEAQPSQHSAITSPTGATYYYGKRGAAARLLRIYNKILEAAAHGKLPWMEPIWLENGWDGKTPVWRVEIEHGSEWLSSHGFTSMLDLEGCERALWEHYTQGVRHTCGTNTRMKNRQTSPIWQAITVAALSRLPGTWKWCPREVSASKDVVGLIKQASGCVAAAIKALSVSLWNAQALTNEQMQDAVIRMVCDEIKSKAH